MRILHLVGLSHRRGAELVAIELAHELAVLGHENSILALGLAADGSSEPGLPVLVNRSGVGPVMVVQAALNLRLHLRRHPVDLVMAHGGWAVQTMALARGRHGPVVVWQRILELADVCWRVPQVWWWRWLVRKVDAAVALTKENVEEMARLDFDGPVWTIANARRPERFATLDRVAEQQWLRDEVGVGSDVELVGFVGHLVVQKRPERSIEVLARLREKGRNAHLVIAGGGTLADDLRKRVQALGLEDHVSLLGHRNDVERILAGVDVALITSDIEGIPGVAIEAQMAGTPVVTFPVGEVATVIEDDVTGIVLSEPDTPMMAEAVHELLGDRRRLAEMGTRARAKSADFAAHKTARIYAARLGSLKTPPSRTP